MSKDINVSYKLIPVLVVFLAGLATMPVVEARYAMEGLLRRYKSISHAQSAMNERTHSTMLRGFHHLWLDLESA